MSKRVIALPDQYNMVSHFIDRHVAEGRGGKVVLRCGSDQVTYQELARLVNRVGNGLRVLGVEEEQRVLLLLPDCPEFAAAYFGTIKIGAVPIPTNTSLRPPDYAYFLDESRARILVVHSEFWPQVELILRERNYIRHVVVVGEPRPPYIHWNEWLDRQSPELQPAKTSKDDVAFWLWTSGSTGLPKGAVHLHHDWVSCCELYAREVLDLNAEDITFSSSKLFHAYGLGNGLLFPLHVGATSVLYSGRPTAQAILKTAHEVRPTLFFSVPTLYASMLQQTDDHNPYDLSSVRLGVSAAEPLPAEIFRRWRARFGFEILDGIGSTEALHIYISARPGRVKAGSSGEPVPGYDIRITDEHNNTVAPGEIGDLWVRAESIAPHYWNRHQLSKQRMQGEWFFTGDKYRQDPEGYLWYAGRSDDMFRVSGQWVSPAEVEGALVEHPAVLESAVVPYMDETGLLKPKAYIVLKDAFSPADELAQELQQFVKNRIAAYKYPRQVEFVPELPKTAAGKIQRYKLRAGSYQTANDK